MKKIGILTFHGADNFGCVLQCMALQNAIKNICDDVEVEVINYVMPNIVEKKLLITKKQYEEMKSKFGIETARKRVIENLKTFIGRKQRQDKFIAFRKKELNLSGERFSDTSFLQACDYDICIVGSDQVWNKALVRNKEDIFFLGAVDNTVKKVSYAASTGHGDFESEELTWLKGHLAQMNHISIREKSALEAIQSIAPNRVSVCLDPTMLHSAEYWRSLERKPKNMKNEKFVFMYGLGYAFCKEQEKAACQLAKDIAEKEGLTVVHYYYGDYRKRFADNAKHCYFQGPYEFLWLVNHAEYVINCSYHGTVFSVMFQKPFYTYSTGNNSARMRDLVETLGIEDRYLEENFDVKKASWDIDWDKVNDNWKREQDKSLEYLRTAIEGE